MLSTSTEYSTSCIHVIVCTGCTFSGTAVECYRTGCVEALGVSKLISTDVKGSKTDAMPRR